MAKLGKPTGPWTSREREIRNYQLVIIKLPESAFGRIIKFELRSQAKSVIRRLGLGHPNVALPICKDGDQNDRYKTGCEAELR